MSNYPGKLIVIYGINNLGKSVQAKLLVERLRQEGYRAQYLKYPLYELTPSGPILNEYLRRDNPHRLSPREAQTIYAFNRFQYQEKLETDLAAGAIIVAEDYKGTGIAWGLGAGVEENYLKTINAGLVEEDLVFLFDGERFKEAVENNHRHENDEDLLTKVRWAHLKLRQEYGWLKINANRPIDVIQEELWHQVKKFLTVRAGAKKAAGFQSVGEIINKNAPEKISFKIDGHLLVEKISPEAKLPQKAHVGDAAYDLYAAENYSLAPYAQTTVKTGVKMAIPEGYVGLIWDKSGLAAEGITTLGGVIDANYRGEVKVVVKNLSEDIFHIAQGQKVAQILIQPVLDLEISESPLNETERQENGFGSSGKF